MSAGEMRPQPSRQELPKALTGSAFLDYAVHLSRRHGFLYVVNPKVGCSSILWTLQRLEAQDAGELVTQGAGGLFARAARRRPGTVGCL